MTRVFIRQSTMLNMLYVRGRRNMMSTITATQKLNDIHPIIRDNATELYVYRLWKIKDLDTFVDEVSAVFNKKSLIELYHIATSEHYSFLYVVLAAADKIYCFTKDFIRSSNKKKTVLKLILN